MQKTFKETDFDIQIVAQIVLKCMRMNNSLKGVM